MPSYWIQTKYGEVVIGENHFNIGYVGGSSGGGIDMGDPDMGNVNQEDNINRYKEMIFDATGPEFEMCSQPSNEVLNLEA